MDQQKDPTSGYVVLFPDGERTSIPNEGSMAKSILASLMKGEISVGYPSEVFKVKDLSLGWEHDIELRIEGPSIALRFGAVRKVPGPPKTLRFRGPFWSTVGWVDADEFLPEPDKYVVVETEDAVALVAFRSEDTPEKWCNFCCNIIDEKVVRWCPLPLTIGEREGAYA